MKWTFAIMCAMVLCMTSHARAQGKGSASQPNTNTAAGGKHVRLLAIGNSFSANALRYLPQIVAASGSNTLTVQHICIGGCPLKTHWKDAEAYQKGVDNAPAHAWAALTAEKWDYVTIQQYSMDSFKVETYRPYARKLYDYIKTNAPQAEVLIHETWAYRADDPLFRDGKFSQQDMYGGVRRAYETIAGELGCRIIPSGDAFENAYRDPKWKGTFPDPEFDYKNPEHPALPDQTHSLHSGYHWGKDKQGVWHLSMDGHHAGAAGEYLAGAVWFEVLFGQSVVGNSFVPKELTRKDVTVLQEIAHRTVTEGVRPKP